jgi:DNA gyrase subunit A
MPAPDFPGGAEIIYDREQMKKIYETGVGSFKMRAKYQYVKKENQIEILEIPYSSCIEAIMKKAKDLIVTGKLREVTDVRDAIDLNGFKLIFALRKDANPELVMQKLFSVTELENNFDCNFNILVEGTPMQLGVKEILKEWITFRVKCYSRELKYELGKKEDKLELLLGLAAILLDIDKAIKIIRNTEKEEDVVPNLASGFNLNTRQAEYIAEIKLRNLNRQYILNSVQEIESLRQEIEELKEQINTLKNVSNVEESLEEGKDG